ncbi:UpxY family transcription antiterminator [Chitinophaga varians]|uniref:UpxY family transcription antiterminator n=1 Tax=Chitinophaga varians TaxID=2202339 RepID=A0A847RZS3_9BACT|nr:UpxY family transcription antiterminator [Chitinophaga varians]NLR68653.1 UpxY family transcription antiterminator [Chitinophaga varians]
MMVNFRPAWFLIYTRPRQERKVCLLLSRMNIHFYLPLNKVSRQWKDRKKTINEPLFPSYVFVYITTMQEYYDSLHLDGVCNYVKFGKDLAKVEPEVVENIRLVVAMGTNVEVSYASFKQEEKMTIQDGPLSGLSCEIIRGSGKYRILVRVMLLKRNIVVDLPSSYVISSVHQ